MKLDCKSTFFRSNHGKRKKDNLNAFLLPSVIGIVLCAVCLVGTTFAWFSATQTAGTQAIQAATFSADVNVDSMAIDDTITLDIGTHTISITASGTASMGYFVVECGDRQLHTVQVEKGETITFTLIADRKIAIKITPQWGASAKTEEEKIKNGDILVFGDSAPIT